MTSSGLRRTRPASHGTLTPQPDAQGERDATPAGYLGPAEIRDLAGRLELRPTKQWGQNFVVDANTVRRIVRLAGVGRDDAVVEIGPGLGSLTLALLAQVGHVTAIEVDPALVGALPDTVRRHQPDHARQLTIVAADALTVTSLPKPKPTALVANLPYNISVPVTLNFLQHFPTITTVLVMVQLEVAQRLAAAPGSKAYGAPSAKVAWYGSARLVGKVPRAVFWPVPNVDSGLVRIDRHPVCQPGAGSSDRADKRTRAGGRAATRDEVFRCIDAAFAQRRKTLRAALAPWAGSPALAEQAVRAAGIDPATRGEQLGIDDFAKIAAHKVRS